MRGNMVATLLNDLRIMLLNVIEQILQLSYLACCRLVIRRLKTGFIRARPSFNGGGVEHRNIGPSVTGHACRFSKFFFDNNVCNRKRCTYLKVFSYTPSKKRNIKLSVNSRSNPTPFTCKPLK